MHRLRIVNVFLLIVALFCLPQESVFSQTRSGKVTNQSGSGYDDDEREIRKLIDQYAEAVDKIALSPNVWDTSKDVTFIQPRGHQKGWKAIKSGFYEKTMGGNFSKRELTVDESTVQIRVYNDAAWAEFYWTFDATMSKDGSTIQTKGRETQVYRKTENGWRIVHVHYSSMPVTGDRQGF